MATDDGPESDAAAVGAGPGVAALAREVRARGLVLRCTLGVVAAWSVTLAPIVVSGRASWWVRGCALVTLPVGLLGSRSLRRNPVQARRLGISLFLGLSAVTWALASLDDVFAGFDPFRAILGSVGWGVYALGWSHPWSVPDDKLEHAPEGDTSGLRPRRTTPLFAVGMAGAGIVGAAACLGLAWRVSDPDRAVFAQAIAVGAAVAVLTAASTVATVSGRERRRDRGRRRWPIDRTVVNTLLLMAMVSGAALGLYVSR
ncbi:MAG: hypothetical protein AAF928_13210 [Myxococcota bacterium]